MEGQIEYLRARLLCDHLQELSLFSTQISQEISGGLTYASTMSLLGGIEEDERHSIQLPGGVTTNDVARYGERGNANKLSQGLADEVLESLDVTLKEVALYYHAGEELESKDLHSRALYLDKDVQADITRNQSDLQELSSRLETVLALHQEAEEVHLRLETSLDRFIQTLPGLLNANHSASQDLLALTIETSLLKLSVVRARVRASLYGHTSSSSPGATMIHALHNLNEKFVAQQRALDAQESHVQSRLQEYQQLLELVDGEGGGFSQVVEDLAVVKRETENCRKDLRRLGWTES